MIALADDRDCMIRTVFGEADDQGFNGQAAVAHVILNRAKIPAWWGRSIGGVCCASSQFSCWNPGDPNGSRIARLAKPDADYIKIGVVVDAVLDGYMPDLTGGATHYKVIGTKASWDKATLNVVPVIIGKHAFYRLGPFA